VTSLFLTAYVIFKVVASLNFACYSQIKSTD